MEVLQRNEVSRRSSGDDQALYTYGVHVIVIVLILDARRVAVARVECPSTGSIETAQPEPSLGKVIEHRCEDPVEVV